MKNIKCVSFLILSVFIAAVTFPSDLFGLMNMDEDNGSGDRMPAVDFSSFNTSEVENRNNIQEDVDTTQVTGEVSEAPPTVDVEYVYGTTGKLKEITIVGEEIDITIDFDEEKGTISIIGTKHGEVMSERVVSGPNFYSLRGYDPSSQDDMDELLEILDGYISEEPEAEDDPAEVSPEKYNKDNYEGIGTDEALIDKISSLFENIKKSDGEKKNITEEIRSDFKGYFERNKKTLFRGSVLPEKTASMVLFMNNSVEKMMDQAMSEEQRTEYVEMARKAERMLRGHMKEIRGIHAELDLLTKVFSGENSKVYISEEKSFVKIVINLKKVGKEKIESTGKTD